MSAPTANQSGGGAAPGTRWRPMERWAPPGTWTRGRILGALRDWFDLTGERPRIYHWSPTEARHLGLYGPRCELWERSHPRWPSATTVANEFGSWVEALQAAGIPAPPPRRAEGTLSERVEEARRLSREGLLQREIAVLVGVSRSTISCYLAASSCRCGEPVIRPRGPVARCQRCARAAGRRRGFDRDSILAAYHAWRAQTGSSPFREDWAPEGPRAAKWHAEYPRWPSAGEACTQFGRWSALVTAAGDAPAQRSWTCEQVSGALLELSDQLGRTPRQSDLDSRPQMPSRDTVARHFGSFTKALTANGMSPATSRYTDAQLLAALKRAHRRLGRPPRPADLGAGQPRAETIAHRFGNFTAALEAAGITPPRRPDAPEVIAALAEAASAQDGRPPRYSDWRRREPPNVWDVERHFGSWSAGLTAAGIEPARRPTRDEVIAALRQEARTRGGQPPRSADWKRSTPPTVADIDRHFGSWNAAIRAAGLTPRAQVARPTGARPSAT